MTISPENTTFRGLVFERFYMRSVNGKHRDAVLQMAMEAHKCLQAGCPKASILVAGKAAELLASSAEGLVEGARVHAQRAQRLADLVGRNELPVLDIWDPEDGRKKEQFLAVLDGTAEIPEGYRILLDRTEGWVHFDPREYACGPLVGLGTEQRMAAIQLSWLLHTMALV